MKGQDIRSRCSVNTNRETDTFVGVRCEDGDITISFPLGFELSEEDRELKKEMLLLFSILAANTDRRDSELMGQAGRFGKEAFPIQAYLHIISDYYARSYYREQETHYSISGTGKISWSRTIRTCKPYVQGTDVFYLDLVKKQNRVKEDELITQIHEFCVYESFEKAGWLFTKTMPDPPRIRYHHRKFLAAVREKLSGTFNDRNRLLFKNMLAVIEYRGERENNQDYRFGTKRFEYIWERMIDRVFGIENKADYFPRTVWRLGGGDYANSVLRPDTIMLYRGDIYVLDAKYYRYGVTDRPSDLPESASVNKQITYGEYIVQQDKFRQKHGQDMKVYNAFLMPYNSSRGADKGRGEMYLAGEAVSDWKSNDKEYERVQGILIDVRYLMKISMRQDESQIMKLAEMIEKAVAKE